MVLQVPGLRGRACKGALWCCRGQGVQYSEEAVQCTSVHIVLQVVRGASCRIDSEGESSELDFLLDIRCMETLCVPPVCLFPTGSRFS